MYFLEYLLTENIIKKSDLIEALIRQLEELPSFLRIIFDSKFMDEETILFVVKKQLEEKSDYLGVIRKYKLLSEDKILEVFKKQSTSMRSIGDILISKKLMTREDYDQHLNMFIERAQVASLVAPPPTKLGTSAQPVQSQSRDVSVPEERDDGISQAALDSLKELVGTGKVDPNVLDVLGSEVSPAESGDEKVITASMNTTSNEGEVEVSEAALESLRELVGSGAVDESTLSGISGNSIVSISSEKPVIDTADVASNFDEIKRNKVLKVSKMIFEKMKAKQDVSNLSSSLFVEIQSMSAQAKIVKSSLAIKLLDSAESISERLLRPFLNIDETSEWALNAQTVFNSVIDLLWQIRNAFASGSDDASFWSVPENKARYSETYKDLKGLESRLKNFGETK